MIIYFHNSSFRCIRFLLHLKALLPLNIVQLYLSHSHLSFSLCLCLCFLGGLHRGASFSFVFLGVERELVVRHLHVLCLGKLVSQGRYEFGVYLEGERLDLVDDLLQVGFRIAGELDDRFCPPRCLFKLG